MNEIPAGITVILPCAGAGSRLGLKSPKELFEILPGQPLIDFSLAHIREALHYPGIRVAIVIREWKKAVVTYVRQKLPGVNVTSVMFNDDYLEWPGSVYSAQHAFSEKNLVLLPDSRLDLGRRKSHQEIGPVCFDNSGTSLVESMSRALNQHPVVFGCIKNSNTQLLGKLGALHIDEAQQTITAFQDKPQESLERYNGFWGCYGFRAGYAKELYQFLVASVQHQQVIFEKQSFYPPGAVIFHDYRDFGTWQEIEKFREELNQ